jgi:hypothetical protein
MPTGWEKQSQSLLFCIRCCCQHHGVSQSKLTFFEFNNFRQLVDYRFTPFVVVDRTGIAQKESEWGAQMEFTLTSKPVRTAFNIFIINFKIKI